MVLDLDHVSNAHLDVKIVILMGCVWNVLLSMCCKMLVVLLVVGFVSWLLLVVLLVIVLLIVLTVFLAIMPMQVFVPCALLQSSHANTATHQQSALTVKTPSTYPLQTHAQSARQH